jgi:DNA-binding GntR family transcriptional regulator
MTAKNVLTKSEDVTFTYRRDRGAKRQQLPEEVASYVRELIVSGEVKQGEFLRMERIAEAVGVSNTPVREGLLLLSNEGFVKLVPRRGFVVSTFSPEDIRDLFWAQAQLAGELAARAAKRATPEQIARMEAVNAEYDRSAARGDSEALIDLGHIFHREVNIAGNSPRLARLLGTVVKQLPNRFYAAIDGQISDSQEEHPLIVEAIKSGNSTKARKLIETHISGAADRLIDMLNERGLWDQD